MEKEKECRCITAQEARELVDHSDALIRDANRTIINAAKHAENTAQIIVMYKDKDAVQRLVNYLLEKGFIILDPTEGDHQEGCLGVRW